MTQEQIQLVLKDLCARLPYGVIMCTPGGRTYTLDPIALNSLAISLNGLAEDKPYLRPMSSMTEEEKKEYTSYVFEQPFLQKDKTPNLGSVPMCIDWLNAHQFDYRIDPLSGKTLIGSGLALEAPEGMYKTE